MVTLLQHHERIIDEALQLKKRVNILEAENKKLVLMIEALKSQSRSGHTQDYYDLYL